jgi:tRNA threonylcarbamoyladenosine biosynthesis protein TsaE
MNIQLKNVDLKTLDQLAHIFGKHLKLNDIVLLSGPLGAGKTTFVQFLARSIGIQENMVSPTFTIVKQYSLPKGGELIHMDAYRLEGEKDDQQWMEYCQASSICLIEWPEYLPSFLQLTHSKITFELNTDQTRTLYIDTNNDLLAHEIQSL